MLVSQRSQRMLNGLYVFWLIEDFTDPDAVTELLAESGLACRFVDHLGHARHVFTHRIWEMELLHFEAEQEINLPDSKWVERDELNALPFPSAMKAAREAACNLLI